MYIWVAFCDALCLELTTYDDIEYVHHYSSNDTAGYSLLFHLPSPRNYCR